MSDMLGCFGAAVVTLAGIAVVTAVVASVWKLVMGA